MAVVALGYLMGNIRLKGIKLGVAAVLFMGLLVGSLDPELQIPNVIATLGLAMYVYTIGLASGPGFFNLFRQRGVKDIVFLIGMMLFMALLFVGLSFWPGYDPAMVASMFAGSTTNTPALAALLDFFVQARAENPILIDQAVIGYSITYPMGVLGVMIAIICCQKWFAINLRNEEKELAEVYPVKQSLLKQGIRITNPEITEIPVRDLVKKYQLQVVFGRVFRGDQEFLINWDTELQTDDMVLAAGNERQIDNLVNLFGEAMPELVDQGQSVYGRKRIFVSNPEIAGQSLATLNLNEKYSAVISRIRRGDHDVLATGETVIELGDQVGFVAHRKDIPSLQKLFGDSHEQLTKINFFSFGIGLSIGLFIGMVEFTLPGGLPFRLGYAGGPLIAGLVLGSLRRTGQIVWTLPYNSNHTLQQIGLIFLLATIGVNAGFEFFRTLFSLDGFTIFLSGAVIVFMIAVITMLIGHKVLKIPFSILIGMIANQPAILDFAKERTKNNLPLVGFSLALPALLIIKILLVQIIFLVSSAMSSLN